MAAEPEVGRRLVLKLGHIKPQDEHENMRVQCVLVCVLIYTILRYSHKQGDG